MIPESVKQSGAYTVMTKEHTVESIVGKEKFTEMQNIPAYRFISDWAGLATNKVGIGLVMDARAELLPGTSALARAISLGVHSITSPIYTAVREQVYKRGHITSDRSRLTQYGAELLAFNAVQTNLYWMQVAAAMGIRAVADPSVEFEPEIVANAAFAFFRDSWMLAAAGKWSMNLCRRTLGQALLSN